MTNPLLFTMQFRDVYHFLNSTSKFKLSVRIWRWCTLISFFFLILFLLPETFNCNVATGMHLISKNRWANTSESSVHTTCASVGYIVITRVEAEGTCVQAFVNHISDRVGSSTVIWVDNGTSISCYKNTTGPCPTLATPVCKRTGTIAGKL